MLPGRPALESVVHAHSDQLLKLDTDMSSAFAQISGEIGDLRHSATATSMALTSLSNQVTTLTDLISRLLPVCTGGKTEPAPPAVPPSVPAPSTPPGPSVDPRWEPTLSVPNAYAGGFDRCRGYLGQCELLFRHHPSRYPTEGARVALIVSTLTGRALDWAVTAVRQNPRLSYNLGEFLEDFRREFDHPTRGLEAAGHLPSLGRGTRRVVDPVVRLHTAFLVKDEGLRERRSERTPRADDFAPATRIQLIPTSYFPTSPEPSPPLWGCRAVSSASCGAARPAVSHAGR